MDSERDELIDLIGDASPSIPVKADWECLADAILAAGYRRVDAEHVVVNREDFSILLGDMDWENPQDYNSEFFALMTRLRHALSAGGE